MTKQYMYITDELRAYRSDERNITLEKLSTGVSPKTRKPSSSWCTLGYFRTYRSAIKWIVRNDAIVDEQIIKDLQDYLREIEIVHEEIDVLVERIDI